MGKILDDMTRLRDDMDRGHAQRQAEADIRASDLAVMASGVVDMIGGFASTRRAQFATDQAARGAFIGNIVQGVQDLSAEVGAMMERTQEERTARAEADASVRRSDVAERVGEIRTKLEGFRDDMEAFRDEFAATAEQDARTRLHFVADKAQSVADFLGSFRKEHDEQSAADRKARSDFVTGVSDAVHDTLQKAEESRLFAAVEDAAARRDLMSDISTEVRTLTGNVAADLAGIRGLFSAGAGSQPKPVVAKAKPAPAKPVAKPAAKPAAEPMQRQAEPVRAAVEPTPPPAMAEPEPKVEAKPQAAETEGDGAPGGGKREAKKQGGKTGI